ncbi:MAG: hypothetical protein AB7F65_02240 [Dehalococcoidia bacterium]
MSRSLRWTGLLGLFVLAAAFTACVGSDDSEDGESSGGGGDAQAITVTLGDPHEFAIQLSSATASAGEVTYTVTNSGALPHSFAIVRHEGDPSSLPVTGVDVDAAQVEILGDTGPLDPGASGTVTVELEPGAHVVFSNTSGHYTAGMFAPFTVE